VSAEYTDGDFRTMTDDLFMASNSSLQGNLAVKWQLGKFFPADWGLTLPLGTMASGALKRPLYKPNTDILLANNAEGRADRLGDMFGDAVEMVLGRHPGSRAVTPAEHYQSTEVTKSWYTNFAKANTSDKVTTKLTAERITGSYKYNYSMTSAAQGETPDGTSDHVDTSLSETYTGDLKYDLTPRKRPTWTSWKPLGKIKTPWVPRPLKDVELTLLPSTLRFDLLGIRYARTYRSVARSSYRDEQQTFDLAHGFTFNYQPIKPWLGLGYSIDVKRDLDDEAAASRGHSSASRWLRFVRDDMFGWHTDPVWASYGVLRGEEERKQNASLDFKPKFFEWLTHDFDYDADFSDRLATLKDDPNDYYDLNVDSRLGFRSTFQLTSLLGTAADRFSKVKALQKTFSGMEKGLTKISLSTLNFTYNAKSVLQNRTVRSGFLKDCDVSSLDYLSYQLGLEGRSLGDLFTGDMDDERALGGMQYRKLRGDLPDKYNRDTRTVSRDWSLSSSFNIPDPVKLSVNPIRLAWDKRYSAKPDTSWVDTTTTWPSFSIDATTSFFDNIGFVKKYLDKLSVRSKYSYEKSVRVQKQSSESSWLHSLDPLTEVNLTVKKIPINARYTRKYSNRKTKSQTLSRTKETSDNITINYEIRKAATDRAIKIFRWSIPIKGKLTLGVTADRTHAEDFHPAVTDEEQDIDRKPTSETEAWSLNPKMTYQFTDNVNAELGYMGSKETTKPENVKTYRHLIELLIKITF
jgi:hypothetical protein